MLSDRLLIVSDYNNELYRKQQSVVVLLVIFKIVFV